MLPSSMKMDSFSEKTYRLEELMPLIREQLAAGKNVRFSPKGTSMLPMLRQGIDNVILSPLPGALKKYDLPLYQRKNGQYVLHRVVRAGETYTCIGDNQFELEPGVEHCQMIAIVTGFTRGNELHSVTEAGYLCYCRFWYYSRPLRGLWRRGIAWIRRHLR